MPGIERRALDDAIADSGHDLFIERQRSGDNARRVDDSGDAVIGGANEKPPVFDCAHASYEEVLLTSF